MRRFAQAFSSPENFDSNVSEDLQQALVEAPDRYNVAVRKMASVIVLEEGAPAVKQFQWGLIPRWSKAPETKYTTVTARLDRAADSRIFKQAWNSRHCVVPMNGYYKWDRTAKPSKPYFIQAAAGCSLMVAGLWECWEKDEPAVGSFTILTHPNKAIPTPLVPDGPIFLNPDRWLGWLDAERWFPKRYLLASRQPQLEAYPVSRAIRDPARDEYTLLEPVYIDDYPDDEAAQDDFDEDDL